MKKRISERRIAAGLMSRLIKRLPEIILVMLLVFTGLSIWMETENAQYAAAFADRFLFDHTHEPGYIPLSHKLFFTVPALLLVFLFVEDIIRVSVMNEPPDAESV